MIIAFHSETKMTALTASPAPPPLETQDFLARLSDNLKPDFDERLSAETKGLRNAVLALGLVLMLLASGGIVFAEGGALAGIKFALKAKGPLTFSGIVVESILLVAYCSRCSIETVAWQIRELPKAWALQSLNAELSVRENAWLNQTAELQKQVEDRFLAGERSDELNALSEELNRLVNDEEASHYRELSKLMTSYMKKAVATRRIRFALEVVFPLLFGVAAVTWASVAALCGGYEA